MAAFPSVLDSDGEALVLDPSRLLLGFAMSASDDRGPRRRASRADIEAAVAPLHLGFEDDPWSAGRPASDPRLKWALWVRDLQDRPIDDHRIEQARQALAGMCDWIGPVYGHQTAGGLTVRSCPLPGVLLIGLRDGLSDQEIQGAIAGLTEIGLRERRDRSQHLGSRYFTIDDPLYRTVYELRPRILRELGSAVRHVRYEQMPFLWPYAYEPRDEHYGLQWNMPLIQAPQAWDLTLGDPDVVIAVIDSGCDLGHPDLSFVSPGVNLRDPSRDGSPTLGGAGWLSAHGTNVAGIAAAIVDNAPAPIGVAGVAGRCRILPLAMEGVTDAQVAAGIRVAADAGARVINLSNAAFLSGELRDAIAEVTADNDHAFQGTRDRGDALIARRNNLAQRNLRIGGTTTEALTYGYSFDADHEDDNSPTIELRVDAGALARDGRVELCLGNPGAAPKRPANNARGLPDPARVCETGRFRLLDPVRVETDWCGCRTVVSFAPGSEIALGGHGAPAIRRVWGAEVVRPGCLRLTRPSAVIVLDRRARARHQVKLACTYPALGRQRYAVHVSRLDAAGRPSGGVTMILGPAS